MIVGNVAALAQNDIKRLLAYSGIAQLGYIVAALAGTTAQGLRYAIFYLAAYTFMNLGAFAVVALLSRDRDEGSRLGAFNGLGYRQPALAAAMTFFLLGLAGLPPTAGFTGKILILASAVNAGYVWLAALLVIGTAISVYAYFKIVRAMYARTTGAPILRPFRPASALPWVGVVDLRGSNARARLLPDRSERRSAARQVASEERDQPSALRTESVAYARGPPRR